MEIEIKRELNGRSISIKTEIHVGKLENVIVEINKAMETFEINRKLQYDSNEEWRKRVKKEANR